MKPVMLRLCMILAFTVSFSGRVVAKAPRCGDVSKRDVRETFDYAKDVRFYYDVRADLNAMCTQLEGFKEWEEGQDKARLSDKSYKKNKEGIVDAAKRSMIAMSRPLTVIRVWFKVDPQTKKQKYNRVIKIREAKNDLKVLQVKLQDIRADVRGLMH